MRSDTPERIAIWERVGGDEDSFWTWEPYYFEIEPGWYPTYYQRTSHAWANKNPEKVVWLEPVCLSCQIITDKCYSTVDNPFNNCEECGRCQIPFREATT